MPARKRTSTPVSSSASAKRKKEGECSGALEQTVQDEQERDGPHLAVPEAERKESSAVEACANPEDGGGGAREAEDGVERLPTAQPEHPPAAITECGEGSKVCSSSEEDRCPVCLNNQIDDLSRLDGCRHAFCYRCIVWWMGVKTECPLCKARVTKISHNFRAPTDGTGEPLFDVITTRELRDQFEMARIQAETSHADLKVERGEVVRLVRRLRTSLRLLDDIAERRKGKGKNRRWRILSANREVLVEWISRFQLLIDDFDQPRRRVISNPSFRAVVYECFLHRVAIVDANDDRERSPPISPSFFVENRAEQFGRIAEFVRRELAVLSELPANLSVEVDPRSAVEIPFSFSTLGRVPPESLKMESQVGRVYELMCEHQINAPMFASTLRREGIVGGAHVNHFVELLFDFVSSFQSLDLFDENSRYLSDSLWRERQRRRQRIVGNYGDAGEDDVLFYSEVLRPSGSRLPADAMGPSPSPSSHRFHRRAGPSAPSPLTHRLHHMFRRTPYFAYPITGMEYWRQAGFPPYAPLTAPRLWTDGRTPPRSVANEVFISSDSDDEIETVLFTDSLRNRYHHEEVVGVSSSERGELLPSEIVIEDNSDDGIDASNAQTGMSVNGVALEKGSGGVCGDGFEGFSGSQAGTDMVGPSTGSLFPVAAPLGGTSEGDAHIQCVVDHHDSFSEVDEVDVDSSASSNEEIYVHDSCRLPPARQKRAIVEGTPAAASSISYSASLHSGDRCSSNSGSAVGENDITGCGSAKDRDDNEDEVVFVTSVPPIHERVWPTVTIDDEDEAVGNVADVAAANRDHGPSSLRSPEAADGDAPDREDNDNAVITKTTSELPDESEAVHGGNAKELEDCAVKTVEIGCQTLRGRSTSVSSEENLSHFPALPSTSVECPTRHGNERVSKKRRRRRHRSSHRSSSPEASSSKLKISLRSGRRRREKNQMDGDGTVTTVTTCTQTSPPPQQTPLLCVGTQTEQTSVTAVSEESERVKGTVPANRSSERNSRSRRNSENEGSFPRKGISIADVVPSLKECARLIDTVRGETEWTADTARRFAISFPLVSRQLNEEIDVALQETPSDAQRKVGVSIEKAVPYNQLDASTWRMDTPRNVQNRACEGAERREERTVASMVVVPPATSACFARRYDRGSERRGNISGNRRVKLECPNHEFDERRDEESGTARKGESAARNELVGAASRRTGDRHPANTHIKFEGV